MSIVQPMYKLLSGLVSARAWCDKNGSSEGEQKHFASIEHLVSEYFPSGAGFDSGTAIDLDVSTGNKLVFNTSFHHMDDSGYYCEWTEHRVTIRPDLQSGFHVASVSGRDRNEIKEYIAEVFATTLLLRINRDTLQEVREAV